MPIQTIQKILIANRGEIARRIARTCRALGIEVVAVHSEADADALFVREADEAVCIGPAPSAESYLRVDKILEAAKATNADAVHPGYGFLAENAAFARAVGEAGLVFIGPTPEAIDAMGSKKEAKALVAEAGVPVVPGYDGASQDPAKLAEEAGRVGYPLLLKASAGGGGKGMKRVDRPEDLDDAIASAKREAKNAFGDDTLLIEKYVVQPRHIEVQILGDTHGAVMHLFERECSIQRRHQKVLEESPSPALDDALRERICEAALQVARAIGYVNAGTVEFILAQPDASGERAFYFLEVNTRLQVEHPVTEGVTGLDLVRAQIRVAEGHPLPEGPTMRGAALEARLYAEDPDGGYLPQSGRLLFFRAPTGEGVRIDGGVESGTEIGIHYDPMLAKIITTGADREEARRRMVGALRELAAFGIRTNRDHLLRVLRHPAYIAGELHTHFLDEHALPFVPLDPALGCIAATLAGFAMRRASAPMPSVPRGFRNNLFAPQSVGFSIGDEAHEVRYVHDHRQPGRFTFFDAAPAQESETAETPASRTGRLLESRLEGDAVVLRFELDGVQRRALCVRETVGRGARWYVQIGGQEAAVDEQPRYPERVVELPAGACVAPMPGKVVTVDVAEGDTVTEGQRLVVMEAMKMEHTVLAPTDGTVASVRVAPGDQVEAAELLVVVE